MAGEDYVRAAHKRIAGAGCALSSQEEPPQLALTNGEGTLLSDSMGGAVNFWQESQEAPTNGWWSGA